MYKLYQSLLKEFHLSRRDFGGIVILFIMPILLIITITLIQDNSYQNFKATEIPILWLNQDKGNFSKKIESELKKNKNVKIISISDRENLKNKVFDGEYSLGIVIPKNLSQNLNSKIESSVNEIISSFGMEEKKTYPTENQINAIEIYFDPASNANFRNNIKNNIDKIIFQLENQKIYHSFQKELGGEISLQNEKLITFKEISPKDTPLPNAVQHNVPAWSLFAIFFIVVPLSISIIKEKRQGTSTRLKTSPTGYSLQLLAKTIIYLLICMIQFLLILGVGIFIFPQLKLNAFHINGIFLELLSITFFAGLAAIGLGILIGTICKTQEQSAPLGATSVVIMAAIGGIWIPVFLMPTMMQKIAKISPMNWALEAYYHIILRKKDFVEILHFLILLFMFYIVCFLISNSYEKKQYLS